MEHAQGAAGWLPGARAWRRPHGGRRVPPQEEAPGRGMGTGRAVLGAKATEAGGQRRGRGRAPPEYPCIWDSSGAALGRRGAGDRKTAPSSLSPLAPRACLGTGEVFRRADGAAWPNPASFLEFFSKLERSLFNFRSPSELRGASSAPQPTWRSPGSSYMAASFSISGRHLWGLLCFLLGAGLFLDRTHPGPGKGTRGGTCPFSEHRWFLPATYQEECQQQHIHPLVYSA